MRHLIVLSIALASTFGAPEAPYPPSGWKPSGQQFSLPSKNYGTPNNQYGPPSTQYGPTEETTDSPTTTTTEAAEETTNSSRFTRPRLSSYTQGNGQFFIIATDGQIQQITVPDARDQRDNEPDAEQVEQVRPTVGKLVQLPARKQETEYFALTSDGRLQRLQANEIAQAQNEQRTTFVLQASGKLQQLKPRTTTTVVAKSSQQQSQPGFLLQPDGRLQRVAQLKETPSQFTVISSSTNAPQAEGTSYFLQPDGRLQRVELVQPVREETGEYNLALPDGQVQRVQYRNILTPDNRIQANVQYQDVAPINGPLYTFGSPLTRVS